jgi:hypothetical protein
MFIIFLAFCAPIRTLLMMPRSIASCHSLAMATPSPTMRMSLRTRAAVLVAKLHTRTSFAMLFREAAGAVLFPTALDVEDRSSENDLAAVFGRH